MSKIYKILTFSLIALAFTPLVVTHGAIYPFIFGKVGFIRLIIAVFAVLFSAYLWKGWREGAIGRVNFSRLKNPIFIAFAVLTLLSLVGVFFAPNSYVAFFGNIERGEGFLILLYMLILLAGMTLLFEEEEWTTFFKLMLVVSFVVAFDALSQYFAGQGARPGGSFLGNPIFVSTYLLFGILSALLVRVLDRNRLWRILAYGSIPLFVLTMLATQTRGILVGLIVSVVVLAVALVLRSDTEKVKLFNKEISQKQLGVLVLAFMIIFSGIFITTRSHSIWQKIPGLDRLAQISTEDLSTQTRLINVGPSLRAVNPMEVGWGRTMMGWGQDNFNIVYERFYDPHIQKYEVEWFDRSHNKILDVLVMNGVLGLGVYLTMWFYIFRYGFMRKRSKEEGDVTPSEDVNYQLIVLFIATTYFVQNLFVFDQISTYVPLFALIGFIIYRHNEQKSDQAPREGGAITALYVGISSLLAILLIFGFVWLSAIPYHQMNTFLKGRVSVQRQAALLDPIYMEENLDKITRPINYAQAELRERMLAGTLDPTKKEDLLDLSLKILALHEATAPISSGRPRAYSSIGFVYNKLGKTYGLPEFFSIAEDNFKKSLELAPGRQETMFHHASNMVSQGKVQEAVTIANNIIAIEPDGLWAKAYWIAIVAPSDWNDERQSIDTLVQYYGGDSESLLESDRSEEEAATKFIRDLPMIRSSYNNYLGYFFRVKDSASFLMTMKQALKIEEAIKVISEKAVSLGVLSSPIEDGVENMKNGIRTFTSKGWDAISLGS
ncbi:MAG: O-antigen ligase family protein [Candidatus Colwellbacteria bacterium]